MASRGDFVANLGKIYGIYTGGFVAFVILMAILEQLGTPDAVIGYLFMGFTIAIYALIGIISRTTEISEYYVAGRRVPAIYNGMATGADWMSAASFISMAGSLYVLGYDGLGYVLGWTGGYVLVAVLLAPYLRKFGIFTVPDFLGARYEGNLPRLLGIIVLFSATFTYLVAQIVGVGIITSRFLQIPFGVAVFVGLAGILVCSMLGGMRAVTWTQVAQYIILIIAYIIPVAILSAQLYGLPIPELTYGQALERITELEQQMGVATPHVEPFTNLDPLNFFALILCLMIGTASLPHILMRYFTTPTVRDARKSVGWSLFFIFLLYFTAPAYAAFAKLEIYENVIGQTIASLPIWVENWHSVGLVSICDAVNAGATVAGCVLNEVPINGNGDGILQLSEFRIHPDAIVLATPEIANLPYVIAGLVAAGGLAAALSTADGLLLAIANALSHDVYYKMLDPKASTSRRLIVARILLLAVAVIGAYSASFQPAVIVAMVAWAFSLAAAGLFVPLVLGIWWKRTTKAGACAGIAAGFLVCLVYLVGTQFGDMELWWGVRNISSALFGLPVAFVVTIVVSLMTPEPSKEMQDLVDSVRIPRGEMPVLRARALQQ
jgi:cation/acetate symporter